MTVKELKKKLKLKAVCLPDECREVTGCYIGDLLSFVMSSAKSGDAWLTIMSNINIVAVATLCDTSTIILTEGVTVDDELIKTANEKNVNILSTEESAFALTKKLSELI